MRRALLVLGAVALLGGAAHVLRPPPPPPALVGMVRATEIRLAPEIGGRLQALPIRAGQRVRRGDVIATVSNPELEAALGEARAALAEAAAERSRTYAGVRREEVEILGREVQKAQSALALAELQQGRVASLAANGNAAPQDLDRANADLARARSALSAARSRHAEAQSGPMTEERVTADARVASAEASVGVLESRVAKLTVTAPADGTVRVIVAETGEIIPTGRPVATLEPDGGLWLSFVAREDALGGLGIGSALQVETADGQARTARITELRALGAFATWRAARAAGDHDLNSLAIRADLTGAAAGLEPGMTVLLRQGFGGQVR